MSQASLRDELSLALGFSRRGGGSLWWGACYSCGATGASLGVEGYSCVTCGLAFPLRPDDPGSTAPEPLPVDGLPPALRDQVGSVARATQTAPEMAALFGLCAVSAACAGKLVVRVDDAHTSEWVTFYGAVVAPPGERKSPTFREMTAPLRAWESDEAARIAPLRRAAEERADVVERKLARVKNDAARGKATLDEVESEAIELDKARRAIPVLPGLLAQDSTPEALTVQMAEQGGRVAVLSPEGGPLQILDGRYSDGAARLEELAHAYDGEELRPRRVGRETRVVRRPALTVGVAIQPSVLAAIRNARSMRGQGIFGRMAWVMPRSLIGERLDSSEVPQLDSAAAERYATMLRRLLDWRPATDDDGSFIPAVIGLSPEAAQAKLRFHYSVEAKMRSGGEYEGVRDVAGKAVGRAIRIAALLELASRAEDSRPLTGDPISGWAMEAAVQLCEALMSHAMAVYAEMAMDERTANLRYIIARLRELPAGTNEAELRKATRGRKSIGGAEELGCLLDELEERACVRRVRKPPRVGPGRPASPAIVLHPALSVFPVSVRGEQEIEPSHAAESIPVFAVSEPGEEQDDSGCNADPEEALQPQGESEEKEEESLKGSSSWTPTENTGNGHTPRRALVAPDPRASLRARHPWIKPVPLDTDDYDYAAIEREGIIAADSTTGFEEASA